VAWIKIGLAYALTSVRVPFDALVRGDRTLTAPPPVEEASLEVALGALTIAVAVLAFRAGIAQARGLERHPRDAALAGSAVGLGFAIPMAIAAPFVHLAFPGLGVASLEPSLVAAFVLPLLVGGAVGAVGGYGACVRERRAGVERVDHAPAAVPAPPRLEAAARGGFEAFWWGLGLAFTAFLILAVLQTGATRAYGRAIGSWGEGGAVVVVHHALLLPNQSAMILAVTMGSPVDLTVGDAQAATVSLDGIQVFGDLRRALGDPDDEGTAVTFPGWYLLFLAVPALATVLGGRRAGSGIRAPGERAVRGALGGVVFALLCGLATWAAAIVLPLFVGALNGEPGVGADPLRTTVVALGWGVAGGALGALLPSGGRRPRAQA
jgi:hypothetical protein